MEFDTQEALQKYMKEHPDADPKNHSVKKHEDKSDVKKDEGKPGPHGSKYKKLSNSPDLPSDRKTKLKGIYEWEYSRRRGVPKEEREEEAAEAVLEKATDYERKFLMK